MPSCKGHIDDVVDLRRGKAINSTQAHVAVAPGHGRQLAAGAREWAAKLVSRLKRLKKRAGAEPRFQ
jgi:hypothetical protein